MSKQFLAVEMHLQREAVKSHEQMTWRGLYHTHVAHVLASVKVINANIIAVITTARITITMTTIQDEHYCCQYDEQSTGMSRAARVDTRLGL